jgi:hypothetical protein
VGRTYLALSNVGWFYASGQPPLVPEVMLSLDVTLEHPPFAREGRSYFQWIYGKPPDLVIECVSDRRGDEESYKLQQYARQRLLYYVIFDPQNLLNGGVLRAYEMRRAKYEPIDPRWFDVIGLGLTQWDGEYRGLNATWLRWCDREGKVLPTGAEQAARLADRAERLAAQLRALGATPED